MKSNYLNTTSNIPFDILTTIMKYLPIYTKRMVHEYEEKYKKLLYLYTLLHSFTKCFCLFKKGR